jgi:hypothetical protein
MKELMFLLSGFSLGFGIACFIAAEIVKMPKTKQYKNQ